MSQSKTKYSWPAYRQQNEEAYEFLRPPVGWVPMYPGTPRGRTAGSWYNYETGQQVLWRNWVLAQHDEGIRQVNIMSTRLWQSLGLEGGPYEGRI